MRGDLNLKWDKNFLYFSKRVLLFLAKCFIILARVVSDVEAVLKFKKLNTES
jgi:hypothetical protein